MISPGVPPPVTAAACSAAERERLVAVAGIAERIEERLRERARIDETLRGLHDQVRVEDLDDSDRRGIGHKRLRDAGEIVGDLGLCPYVAAVRRARGLGAEGQAKSGGEPSPHDPMRHCILYSICQPKRGASCAPVRAT
jgi:hypothetical protein